MIDLRTELEARRIAMLFFALLGSIAAVSAVVCRLSFISEQKRMLPWRIGRWVSPVPPTVQPRRRRGSRTKRGERTCLIP